MKAERDLIDQIIQLAREFHASGWMWGTSGNLSAKLSSSPLIMAITGSGAGKGRLTYEEIAIVPEGERAGMRWLPSPSARASAETAIHQAVYRQVPTAGSVLHVHTVASTLLSMAVAGPGNAAGRIDVEHLEMLKGLGAGWQDGRLGSSIPVLSNRESMAELAVDVSRLLEDGAYRLPVILVAGHGMTVWGSTISETRDRLEAAEFVCQVLWEQRRQPWPPTSNIII